MITVLIADDEPLARDRLRALLAAETDFKIVGEAVDGIDALDRLRQLSPEVLFLDVQMPGLTGIELIHAMRGERVPYLIFTTAHKYYASEAFDLDAVDYLLKPFDGTRLRRALNRAKQRLSEGTVSIPTDKADRLQKSMEQLTQLLDLRRPLESITVHVGSKLRFLDPQKIRYIKAEGNYVSVVGDGEPVLARERIAAMEERLRDARFLRIHRSVLINVAFLREIRPHGNGDYECLLDNDESFVSGAAYRAEVRAMMELESHRKRSRPTSSK